MNGKLITKGNLVCGAFKINFDADTKSASLEGENGDIIPIYSSEDVEKLRDLLWELRQWYEDRRLEEVV
ncbi:MAG: hypothetical protein JETCAE03_35380 [Ignavibacteriaceae bacterium]|jgi:hypothetical protein|nr:MAG: hypothetical protein JETCAE03_35380 [Ignavibacteriaceae bacterium]